MAVSTKNKRKLVYKDKTYYWYVSQDYDRGELRNNFNILHIKRNMSFWTIVA